MHEIFIRDLFEFLKCFSNRSVMSLSFPTPVAVKTHRRAATGNTVEPGTT
jgi:hypothetical protein